MDNDEPKGEHAKGRIRIGVEAFILDEDRVLLGTRLNMAGNGQWGLPGGQVDQGETLAGCLIRELDEELGITVLEDDLQLVVVHNDPLNIGGHFIHFGFRVHRFEGVISVQEPDYCGEWKFFRLNALPHNLFSGHSGELDQFRGGVLYDNT